MTGEESLGRGPEPDLEFSEADVLAAMQEIPGYLDITPRDFQEIYRLAYRQAKSRLAREVKAAAIMTREVAAVREQTPLAEVAAVMGGRGIAGVPVLDDQERVTGVISEKDFLRQMGGPSQTNFMAVVASCLRSKGCVALPIKSKVAKDIMSTPPIVVSPETTLEKIAALLAAHGINRVPVVDQDGRLVGLVSRGDLVAALSPGGQAC